MRTVLARSVERRLRDFNAQDLVNTAWALAVVPTDESVVVLLARSVERRLRDFNAQDIANTAWALAAASRDESVFATASTWALAEASRDESVVAVLARSVKRRLRDFSAQDLANTVWASATASQCVALLLAALARAAKRRLGNFSASYVANLARVFSTQPIWMRRFLWRWRGRRSGA